MKHAARPALALILLAAASTPAFAQDAAAPDPHRWAVWTSCTVVFALLTVFLVWTHRKTGAEMSRLDAAEDRLSRLEK